MDGRTKMGPDLFLSLDKECMNQDGSRDSFSPSGGWDCVKKIKTAGTARLSDSTELVEGSPKPARAGGMMGRIIPL
jgi:hypothetical protein